MFDLIPFEFDDGGLMRSFDNFEKHFFREMNKSMNGFRTDIEDKGDHYLLETDLPGFDKEDIQIDAHDGYLTITASKGLDKDEKNEDGKYIRRERYSGSCSRSFYVGDGVTEEDIKARFEDGILKLDIPKKDAEKIEQKKYISIEG